MRGYTTHGSVRGCCGHVHQTMRTAEQCAARDQRGCASQRGYSDRRVVCVGEDDMLYYDDDCTEWVAGEGGRSCGAATLHS